MSICVCGLYTFCLFSLSPLSDGNLQNANGMKNLHVFHFSGTHFPLSEYDLNDM